MRNGCSVERLLGNTKAASIYDQWEEMRNNNNNNNNKSQLNNGATTTTKHANKQKQNSTLSKKDEFIWGKTEQARVKQCKSDGTGERKYLR